MYNNYRCNYQGNWQCQKMEKGAGHLSKQWKCQKVALKERKGENQNVITVETNFCVKMTDESKLSVHESLMSWTMCSLGKNI